MADEIEKKHTNAQRLLIVLALLFLIFLISTALYFRWQQYQAKKQDELQSITDQVATKVALLIDNSLQPIYSLPFYGREFYNCQNDLFPDLKTIIFNNPNISAVVISDSNNKVICSTLGSQYTLPAPPAKTPSLYGPIKLDSERINVFLLQQRLGKYYVGVYIVTKIFNFILHPLIPKDILIQLHDIKNNKIIFQIGNTTLSKAHTKVVIMTSPITNLPSHEVILNAYPITLGFDFFNNELLLIIIILLFGCLLLYYKFRQMIENRYSLHYAIANALKHHHFQPVYQPIRDNEANRYCGAEILLRWKTEANEIIMPDTFIVDAEKSGLILPITLQLVEISFQHCQQLLQLNPYFHLAFNLSAIHFAKNNFFEQFYEKCQKYQIPYQQIMFELTERELLDQNDESIVEKMRDLRAKGIALAIDDFGTGHASIKYLERFPFNYLKIDKIFVQAIGTGAVTETLNQAIIDMAGRLQLNIIAEGVETVEQFKYLRRSEVNFMQGWYFAKALSYEQLLREIQNEQKSNPPGFDSSDTFC